MRRALGAHAVRMLFAYLAAAISCTSVMALVLGASILLSGNVVAKTLGGLVEFLFAIATIGSFIAVYNGFLYWLLAVSIAEFGNLRSKYWFACMGMVDAFSYVAIHQGGFGLFSDLRWLISILSGGVAGGVTYWALAGKHSGKWKNPPIPAIPDSVSEGAGA